MQDALLAVRAQATQALAAQGWSEGDIVDLISDYEGSE